MADPGMSVTPYWELTFDADGDVDGPERDRLLARGGGRRGAGGRAGSERGGEHTRAGAPARARGGGAPTPP
ncbi:serine-threonine protein kinase, partial [Streptomyces diastatochromogenes]